MIFHVTYTHVNLTKFDNYFTDVNERITKVSFLRREGDKDCARSYNQPTDHGERDRQQSSSLGTNERVQRCLMLHGM